MIKTYVTLLIYLFGVVGVFAAFSGKVRWTLLLIVLLLPLQNIIDQIQHFFLGKDFLDILIISSLLGWLVRSMTNQEKIVGKSSLNIMAFVLILYTFFSLCRGYSYLGYSDYFNLHDMRVQEWKNYCLFPILFILIFYNINEEKWVWRIIVAMCLSMALVSLYTVKQISWFSGIISRDKINGTFVWLGPNEVAAFLNQYSILLLSLFFALKRGFLKLSLFGLILVSIYCVFFLFSRGAYIGLVAGLFVVFALRKPVFLVPLVIVLLFWQVFLPQEIQTRIEMTTDSYGQLDDSSENRLLIWEQSVDLFKTTPVFGIGFGVFRHLGFNLKDTHNIYLKILAEQGIVGIGIFFTLIFMLIAQGWRLFKKGKTGLYRSMGAGFLACIIVSLINNLFGDRWTYLPLGAYMWVFAGLVARLIVLSNDTSPKQVNNKIMVKQLYVQPA